MSTWEQYKKNRKSNFEKLSEELDKAAGKVEYKNDDDRFWYPAVDKAGNGYAVIRFLPPHKDEDAPFVRVFEHHFQGPNGAWYIEKSLTTLNKQDPVSEFNSKLWNAGKSDDSPERVQARKQKRKLVFISNIYVVKDPANPENEGKVFLFKYGKQVFDVLYAASNPQYEDEVKVDPFDMIDGASMFLKIRNKDGYRNYESSTFDKPAALFKDEKKLKAVWEQIHPIQEFIDPKNFKSYEELHSKLLRVLGENGDEYSGRSRVREEVKTPKTLEADTAPEEAELEVAVDDDEIDYFKKLADDDVEEFVA